MGKTISFGKGKGNIAHNNREYLTPNVDPDRVKYNVYFKQQTIEEAYAECFGQAIEDYNATQKRSDRMKTIDGYMDEIRKNQANRNGEKLFYEQVVGVGDMWDSGILTNPEEAEKCKEVLMEYFEDFQRRNPNLHVFNAVLHYDEMTPHLHIDYIPVAHGYKGGLQARNSLSRAFAEQGVSSKGSKENNGTTEWQKRERANITEIANAHDIEIDVLGVKRPDMPLAQYKAVMRNMEQQYEHTKALRPKRVNMPFGMALETNRKAVDKVIEHKESLKKYAKGLLTTEQALQERQDQVLESLRNAKNYEYKAELEWKEVDNYKKNLDAEKEQAIKKIREESERKVNLIKSGYAEKSKKLDEEREQLQDAKEVYSNAYQKQADLNKNYKELEKRLDERDQKYSELRSKSIKQEQSISALNQKVEELQQQNDALVEQNVSLGQNISWLKETFESEKLEQACSEMVANIKKWFSEHGLMKQAEKVTEPKALDLDRKPKYPSKLIFKGGKQGQGFYDDKGVFWGDRSILPDIQKAGIKPKDPYGKLGISR